MADFFDENWDKLSPEDFAKARARVEAFHESTDDPILKEQLRATISPLFEAQDAIIHLQKFFLT
jgi:hypothetical protein